MSSTPQSSQSVTQVLHPYCAVLLHHTALHALGSFPLAAGTNCEREVDRLAGWFCMSDSGGQARPKIIPTLTILFCSFLLSVSH